MAALLKALARVVPVLVAWHAPAATQDRPGQVGLTAIEALLVELDQQFDAGDVDGYLGRFTPDHAGALMMFGRHLGRVCRPISGKAPTRTSTVVAGPQRIGERSVVRVRHTVVWPAPAGAPADADPKQLVEDSYLAVRAGDGGAAVPTFAIEMPRETSCVKGGVFRCPPCNYEIGGVDGFLCVPMPRERALALEAASFYLIGTDVVCDVQVHVDTTPDKTSDGSTARALVQQLAAAFHELEPTARVGVPARWVPPMHRDEPPDGMDAARVVVELPDGRGAVGDHRATFHAVTFGGLQHVLLVRGGVAALDRHQGRVDELIQSYMLLERDCSIVEASSRPLRHHTGGLLDGVDYQNELFDVRFRGPDGWRAEQRVGGAVFRVRWSGPDGARLWLVGYRVPAGMPRWTRAAAERWLAHQCNRKQLVVDGDAAWKEGEGGVWRRTSVLLDRSTGDPLAPRRRLLHVELHPDLLLVVDGFGDADAEAAVRTAIGTLARK